MGYCGPCDRDFVSREALIQHWRDSSRHGYYCLRCEKPFNSLSALNQHISDSPNHYFCHLCLSSLDFSSRDALDSHQETVHHYCNPCDRCFNTAGKLRYHDISEHNMCGACGKYFQSPSNLNAVSPFEAPYRIPYLTASSTSLLTNQRIKNVLDVTGCFHHGRLCCYTWNTVAVRQKWMKTS